MKCQKPFLPGDHEYAYKRDFVEEHEIGVLEIEDVKIFGRGVLTDIEDLAHHNCIVGQRSGQPLAWVAAGGNGNGQLQRFAPPPTYEIGDGDAIVAAAIAGCGLCQIPEFMVRAALATGELVSVLAEASDVMVDVSAVWPATRSPIPRVRRVIDELASRAARGELD